MTAPRKLRVGLAMIGYKNNLRNFTSNANRREDFVIGIGYDDSINEAQEIARKVLKSHPAVLNDPEPSVLADTGAATK